MENERLEKLFRGQVSHKKVRWRLQGDLEVDQYPKWGWRQKIEGAMAPYDFQASEPDYGLRNGLWW